MHSKMTPQQLSNLHNELTVNCRSEEAKLLAAEIAEHLALCTGPEAEARAKAEEEAKAKAEEDAKAKAEGKAAKAEGKGHK